MNNFNAGKRIYHAAEIIVGSETDIKFQHIIIKLHPADRVAPYEHMHAYTKSGYDLSSELSIVHYRSLEAHIQIAPDDFNYSQEYYQKKMNRR
jgi:hypothetical protein